MDYDSAIDFLYNSMPRFDRIGAGAYKPGLERTLELSAAYGNPHENCFKSIHIAGTNGKGSTAHSLAAVLIKAGYKTGLFTSPHLVDFRERIRVNGEMIPREEVSRFVERYRSLNLGLEPSFFELTTVMAFDWFSRSGVEVAVIETGLGGRLDSTNIITPILSVITNISLDHTSLLGDTPEAIAREKAGIIKPGVPVVVGESQGDVRTVFAQTAADRGCKIAYSDTEMKLSDVECRIDYILYPATPFGPIRGELTGECQPLNMATIMSSLSILVKLLPRINDKVVAEGLANVTALTGLMGRWMTISASPRVIIDTGHNPGGWQYIVSQLNKTEADTRHIIVGMAADKDVDAVVELMKSIKNAVFYFTSPSTPRAMKPCCLAALARKHGLVGETYATVEQAYKKAAGNAGDLDIIFVGGSNFVIADLLNALQ